MIKYIKIMVTVFTLLISCSVTNIFASDTNDVIEEKIEKLQQAGCEVIHIGRSKTGK